MPSISKSHFKETFVVGGLASLLLLILSWPAFKYFFFAETFGAVRIYKQHGGNSLQVAFSNLDGIFFRPGLYLTDLWSNFLLPVDPTVYHIRNYVFCVINLVLLYRILLRLIRSRLARIVALGLFAASKIHFTTIGYMNVVEATVLLMTILLTLLFWLRYIETRRISDYVLGLISCALSVYSKDNGFAVVGVLLATIPAVALEPGEIKKQLKYWIPRVTPFIIIAASYFVVRYLQAGPINPNNAAYSPRLSLFEATRHTAGFLATVGNLGLTGASSMGRPGLSGLLSGDSWVVELTLCAVLWLLILWTLWQARGAWRLLIFPVVWIALYFFPYFLIRNHQIYYNQESLAGLAILIGICLDRAKGSLVKTWCVVIVLIAINGFVSNRRSYTTWQFCSDRAEIVKPMLASLKANPPKSIVFVTPAENVGFWTFTVGGPMVPYLIGYPDTPVQIVPPGSPIDAESTVINLP
jgi:hypothetical protein